MWGFAAIVAGLVAAGGAGLTHWLPPSSADAVSKAEAAQRSEAFTRLAPLSLAPVLPDKVDAALLEMRLEPTQREALQKLLLPGPSSPATPNAAPAPPPVRLVELTLWDSHAPDGDVVRISSAGYGRDILLAKAMQTVAVPVAAGGVLQITGVRDGGGGITLGLRGPQQEVLMPILSEGQTLSLPVMP